MTTKLRASFPGLLFFLLLATGCGDDCVSGCEDSNECEGAAKIDDCDKFCEDVRSEAEKADCEGPLDDLFSCTAGQDDVCKADADACSKEQNAYVKCLAG